MEDDPEKRIAELERRLTDSNTEQGAQEFPLSAARPEFRPPRSRRRYPAILFSAIVLLAFAGCATALVVYFKPSSSDTQLQTAEGLTGLLNEVRNHFGDTMGYELTVYPERAFIDRVDPQENRAEQSYQYRSGDWSEFGDPTPADGSPTDLSKFDAASVAAALATAPQTLTITNPKNIYLIVGSGGDNLSLAIHVSGRGISGHIEINADGTIKEIYPPS